MSKLVYGVLELVTEALLESPDKPRHVTFEWGSRILARRMAANCGVSSGKAAAAHRVTAAAFSPSRNSSGACTA